MPKLLFAGVVFLGSFVMTFSYLQKMRADTVARSGTQSIVAVSPNSHISTKEEIARELQNRTPMQDIPLSSSGAYVLPVKKSWSTEEYASTFGAVEYKEINVFNDNKELVFIIQSPISDDSYQGTRMSARGFAGTKIDGGSSLTKVVRTYSDPNVGGFAHYTWNGAGDFPNKSFEIIVPFRPGLYARTNDERAEGVGIPTAYRSRAAYETAQESIEVILSGIRNK